MAKSIVMISKPFHNLVVAKNSIQTAHNSTHVIKLANEVAMNVLRNILIKWFVISN
jgi:hypothetical protein